MDPTRVLIVANQTAGGSALRAEVHKRVNQRPHHFTLVVPATPPHDHMLWTDGEPEAIARKNLEAALTALRATGGTVEGRVGDASPMQAINDALLIDNYDEIILSTLPPGASRWLKQDLPDRVQRRFDLPLTVIVGHRTVEHV